VSDATASVTLPAGSRPIQCPECQQPPLAAHLGTCSYSFMRTGRSVVLVAIYVSLGTKVYIPSGEPDA
jgi:hypothetical protein